MDNGGMTQSDLLIMAEEDCVYWKSEALRLREELSKRRGTCADCKHYEDWDSDKFNCCCQDAVFYRDKMKYCSEWEKKE
jgi:hypothetical protein